MTNKFHASKVSVVLPGSQVEPGLLSAETAKVIELVGGLSQFINPGDKVLVKPNLVALPPERIKGAITHPMVTKAVADQVLALGAHVVIGDSSAVGVSTEDVIAATDYRYLRDQGYQVKDLKQDSVVKRPVDQGRALKEMPLFQTAAEADLIISVPVMKTHDQVEVSLSIKNLKGILPDKTKKAFHNQYGLPHAVSDLLSAIPTTFAVVDALFALEGMGPVYGDPVPMGMLFSGRDLVAVDSVASQAMGVSESELIIESEAHSRGLGELRRDRIEILGDYDGFKKGERNFSRIKDYQFQFDGIDFQLIFNQDACTGCKNTVLSSLDDIAQASAQKELDGKCVLAGPQEISGDSDCELILVGNCLKHHKNYGIFVPGCPPENHPVIEGMVGEDKVGRRYTNEESSDNSKANSCKNEHEQITSCVRGLIFDLDNTLLNSKINFDKMMEEVIDYLQKEGLLEFSVDRKQHTTATIIEQVRAEKKLSLEQETRIWEIISAVEADGMSDAELEPGIIQLLSHLAQKYCLTVLTNNSYQAANKALCQFQLDQYFDMVVGREQMKSLKPSSSGVKTILTAYPHISHEEWLMVGDSWIDAEAAKRSGVPFLAYNCRVADLERREIPKVACITHPIQILDYV